MVFDAQIPEQALLSEVCSFKVATVAPVASCLSDLLG